MIPVKTPVVGPVSVTVSVSTSLPLNTTTLATSTFRVVSLLTSVTVIDNGSPALVCVAACPNATDGMLATRTRAVTCVLSVQSKYDTVIIEAAAAPPSLPATSVVRVDVLTVPKNHPGVVAFSVSVSRTVLPDALVTVTYA
jgi:hypothetical protein